MINHVVLVGRLTKDVEVKKTQTGKSVASFTLACNRRFGGSSEQSADFINCVAWNQSADFLGQYASKGALVGVEGRISTRNYDDASGKKVYVTEVTCDHVQLLESKGTNENRSNAQYNKVAQPSQNDFSDNNDFADFTSGPTLDISSDDLPF
ncbi:MAG: single-stranded DNA-binding protein [Erysipelotrichaceae bacterium]|nr:single-stranded DNA-binding protein [Erysipelotrichaceae bacterium]